jgi:hypothetical protein
MIKLTPKFRGEIFKKGYDKASRAEYLKAMTEAMSILETAVATNTPVGVSGALQGGIRGTVLTHLRGEVGIEGPASKYGEIIEKGRGSTTRSQGGVSWEPIKLWVRRIIRPPAKKLDSVTYLVWRKIHRKGFKGKFMFRDAERKLKTRVINMFRIATKRIERRLSK